MATPQASAWAHLSPAAALLVGNEFPDTMTIKRSAQEREQSPDRTALAASPHRTPAGLTSRTGRPDLTKRQQEDLAWVTTGRSWGASSPTKASLAGLPRDRRSQMQWTWTM
eukprot:172203-Rhodomonas_salina.1